MKRATVVVLLVLAASQSAGSRSAGRQSPAGSAATDARGRLHVIVDPVIDTLWAGYDANAAMGHVQFISQFWRLPGNAGYDASLNHVAERLKTSGVLSSSPQKEKTPEVLFEQTADPVRAWDHTVGTLAIVRSGQPDEVVLSREKERLALCINSFSTAPGGVVAPIVDVGRGDRDEDYAGKDLKGAVVLGDADAGQLWRRAVVTHGALGVVSAALPAYLNADAPGAKSTPRDQWDILQWSSVPYDEARKGFGFKASPRAAARLRAAVGSAGRGEAGAARVRVRVTIASTFTNTPVRTLVVEIPGRVAPDERIVLAAHVQEPGANDNASGVATLAELAYSMASAIKAGKIPAPGRTLTFLFLTEIGGSRQWLQAHPEDAKKVKYMFSLDMTGEDVTKTGGSFLIERHPDPGAVWDRAWDPHSEWGRGNVRAEQLKGDLINDLHLAICQRVARKTGWVVKTNPYEGGSDHTVFGSAGVPSLLNWHFTDRYYHTNFDTPDKTSPAEMRNVGVAVGASAWLLGSANESHAGDVAEVIAAAGQTRVTLETTEGARLAAADKDSAAARTRETTIVAAWRKWYGQAVRSAARLIVGPASPSFAQRLDRLAAPFEMGQTGAAPLGEIGLGHGVGAGLEPVASQRPGDLGTPFFTCGGDEQIPEIPLRWATAVLAGDGRLYMPCPGVHTSEHREVREGLVLSNALRSRDPELRRLAIQAIGRRGNPTTLGVVTDQVKIVPACAQQATEVDTGPPVTRWQPGTLPRLLATDTDARVRLEAAYAIGAALTGVPGEYGAGRAPDPPVIIGTRAELEGCYRREQNADVAATILETLGRLRYTTDAMRDAVEAFLVAESVAADPRDPTRMLGAAKGLEVLIRQNAKRPVGLPTRQRLRDLALAGGRNQEVPTVAGAGTAPAPGNEDKFARIRRLALLALQTARDDDIATLEQASFDADWQVRRLVALRLDFGNAEMSQVGERLLRDPAFQVRYDLLAALARYAVRTHQCAPLTRFFEDTHPAVVLRAMDLVPPGCTDADSSARLKSLADLAGELSRPETRTRWHQPSHALSALARVDPQGARGPLAVAAGHAVWQVRAAAAVSAAQVGDEPLLVTLSRDREPNVRDAALDGLVRIKSAAVTDEAIDALKSDDYQLIRTAAISLKGTPEARRPDVAEALVQTLRRLTASATDTSRDPRVAIVERLEELLPAERAREVAAFAMDYDAKVRAAATKAFATLTATPRASESEPSAGTLMRYPFQPSAAELEALPKEATIRIEGLGTMTLELYVDQAPVTVARFGALARAGAYDGLTFHRVVPNFVIQGGSPGANEYAGATPRYLRDEVGPHPHVRGAVGISTRGRDTGDAQIFIDLVDVPRLNHDYTVFGRVRTGYDILDRILEGAKIESITVK